MTEYEDVEQALEVMVKEMPVSDVLAAAIAIAAASHLDSPLED